MVFVFVIHLMHVVQTFHFSCGISKMQLDEARLHQVGPTTSGLCI
jgi:hypothetical protein